MKVERQTSSTDSQVLLLEGLLRRLSIRRDADRLVLRGGMLMRSWFHPLPRPVTDLDLTATFPFDVDVAAGYLRAILADRNVADGVAYDTRRVRIQPIWLQSEAPGVRMYSVGEVNGERHTFSVDLTFGEQLTPPPELGDYSTANGDSLRLWMCRPETILGRKVHALWRMGLQHWRPKDLNDIRLIFECAPTNRDDLAAAIAASFTSRGDPANAARSLFDGETWWATRTAAARWGDYTRCSEEPLLEVVAIVEKHLRPTLERMK